MHQTKMYSSAVLQYKFKVLYLGIYIFFCVLLHYIKLLVTLRLFSDELLLVTCNQSDIIEGGTLSETRLG